MKSPSLFFTNAEPFIDFPRLSTSKVIDIGGVAVSREHSPLDEVANCPFSQPRLIKTFCLTSNQTLTDVVTVGMPLQTLHFAYLPDERAFLSERPFYKGKPRLKVRLIPESRYQAADIYFCGGLDSAPLCENWSEIAQK